MIPAKCCLIKNESRIKVNEAKSMAAVFLNPDRQAYCVIRFDGCVLTNEVACDWFVEKLGIGRIAIELKGCDVDHASIQIERALNYLKEHDLTDLRVAGLIVCSRYPSIDTKVQRLKQKLAKNFRAPLHVKTDGRNLNFDQLLVY